ncbi:hypothetical protein BDN70DRAFT_896345 [Pholiota conissans]|uniref:Alpha-type protein kinase domain-containing protein n=1 Tax=Pholiota conissans TaxID=109636 RepID=A0A9P6CYN2_9AGAR|nr:hypothetical protein BDN70DRAFT_896345 [Pholiota conissans]
MTNSIFPQPNINPRPQNQASTCPQCFSHVLSPLKCAGASVLKIENYGRWCQTCVNCQHTIWHSPETLPSQIPPDVQARFIYRAQHGLDDKIYCQEPGCALKAAGNSPRRAAKQCERVPFRCKTCCLKSGGCKVHATAPAEAFAPVAVDPAIPPFAQPLFPEATPTSSATASSQSVPHTAASSQVQPRTTAASSQAQPRTTFARNLAGGYAQGWQAAQLQRHAANVQRQLIEEATHNLRNTVTVVIWTKAGFPPKLINIITPTPGFVIPSMIPIIANLFQGAPTIAFFRSRPCVEWVTQELELPILASQDYRLLIRDDGLTDEDCMNLSSHMEQHLSEIPHIRSVGSDSIRHSNKPPASTEAELTATSLGHTVAAPLLSVQPAPTSRSSTFPLEAAKDMLVRFRKLRAGMDGVKKSEAATKLLAMFTQCFPGCKFNKSTFYREQGVYTRALEIESKEHLIEKYGRLVGERGSWKNFRDDVNRINAKATKSAQVHTSTPITVPTTTGARSPSPPSSPMSISSEMDTLTSNVPDYSIHTISLDTYIVVDGQLTTARDCPDMDMLFDEHPYTQGHRKQIFVMQGPSPMDPLERIYACKSFDFLGGTWYKPAYSAEVGIWVEGARTSKAHLFNGTFQSELAAHGMGSPNFPSFEVVPTFLLTFRDCDRTSRLVQPWVNGEYFHSVQSEEEYPELCDLLSAFSHFCYTFSQHTSAIVEFQGFIDKNDKILRIFDSLVHVIPSEDHTTESYHRNLGVRGVEGFRMTHVCGKACHALGYSPL